jgi:hypothetical protein
MQAILGGGFEATECHQMSRAHLTPFVLQNVLINLITDKCLFYSFCFSCPLLPTFPSQSLGNMMEMHGQT